MNFLIKNGKDKMTTDEIQQIINQEYPKIQKYFGKGKGNYPEINYNWKNTYAMHSDEPEAEGEHDATSIAEYYEGTIYIYLPNIKTEEDVLRALIHEYVQYTQNITPELMQRYRDLYDYDTDPHEIEAHEAEEKWHLFKT